jgi:hypothetical protein
MAKSKLLFYFNKACFGWLWQVVFFLGPVQEGDKHEVARRLAI